MIEISEFTMDWTGKRIYTGAIGTRGRNDLPFPKAFPIPKTAKIRLWEDRVKDGIWLYFENPLKLTALIAFYPYPFIEAPQGLFVENVDKSKKGYFELTYLQKIEHLKKHFREQN